MWGTKPNYYYFEECGLREALSNFSPRVPGLGVQSTHFYMVAYNVKLGSKTEHYCVGGSQHVCRWTSYFVLEVLVRGKNYGLDPSFLGGCWVAGCITVLKSVHQGSHSMTSGESGGSLILLQPIIAGCHIPTSFKHGRMLISSLILCSSHAAGEQITNFPPMVLLTSWWQCLQVYYFISTWICEKLYLSGLKKF